MLKTTQFNVLWGANMFSRYLYLQRFLLLFILAISACSEGGSGGSATNLPPMPTNSSPTANAGTTQVLNITTGDYQLDGSASSDPDGDNLTFAWSIREMPDGANITLSSSSNSSPTFSSMIPGIYAFQLTVTDPNGASDTRLAFVVLRNQEPFVEYVSEQFVITVDDPYTLDATDLQDETETALSFDWEIISSPAGSAIPLTYNGAQVAFSFDVPGEYVIELTVNDGDTSIIAAVDTVYVSSFRVANAFEGILTDAEFNEAIDKAIILSNDQILLVNLDGTVETINLSRSGKAVAVAKDGKTAVVGNDKSVTHIDLETGIEIANWAIPVDVQDIVLDSDGIAYVSPVPDLTQQPLRIVDLATGAVSEHVNIDTTFTAGLSTIRLHPSEDRIYSFRESITPVRGLRYDILPGGGVTGLGFEEPPNLLWNLCQNLWIGSEGTRLMNSCGEVHSITSAVGTDFTYLFQLEGLPRNRVEALTSATSIDSLDSWITFDVDTQLLRFFDVNTGTFTASQPLPFISSELPEVDEDILSPWQARFMFDDEATADQFIIAVDDLIGPNLFALLVPYDIAP